MGEGLATSLSYIPVKSASSLVTIGAIAAVVRKREGLDNSNHPIPECFSIEGSNGSLSFRH